NDLFIAGAEDGTVTVYTLENCLYDKLLTRCTVPIRDIAISPDGFWAAVASDELEVKIVDTRDPLNVMYIRDLPKPPKHLSFHSSGSYLALSCSDGIVYIYSLTTELPALDKKLDDLIRRLESDDGRSSRAIWHPDGRAFAVPNATRQIQVVSRDDGERQRAFSGGHLGDITALAWSPNGALLATAGSDKRILLWETRTQKILARYDYPDVSNIAWHPNQNIFSFVTSDGELFICPNFLSSEHSYLLEKPLQPAPFIHDPLGQTSGNARKALTNGFSDKLEDRRKRKGTPDTLDDILGPQSEDEDLDFIEDDDGAGYADGLNGYGKRTNEHLDEINGLESKRRATHAKWQPRIHQSFQPGSTPWRGSRRYLCLNLTGFVWTVDQDSHHTVTVEFYDREFHRDFHFTDPFLYDKACLTISLSDSYVVVSTSVNYVRVYTLFGTPCRIYRQKSSPTVTCASWRDYVLTMGNGPVGGDGSTRLLYTIENVKRDEVCQSEDTVALTDGARIKNVFFSDRGDPCIYDSAGVLLVLQHWRTQGQARWVPLLDSKSLERLAGGRKEESYWPVAVAQDKFHCIILKGGDQYPYFPKPLLSEFEFKVPCSAEVKEDAANAAANERPRLEESYIRNSLMYSLLEDSVSATNATNSHRAEVGRQELEVDKTLLQLLNVECREGEERGMKALEIVGLLKDQGGKMIEAAGKIAARYGRTVLQDKISELAEKRLIGLDEDEV
ncbi:MAG: hypothetical protein Q9214_005622, partial [Letrouitia sp. 1 TL-2023]